MLPLAGRLLPALLPVLLLGPGLLPERSAPPGLGRVLLLLLQLLLPLPLPVLVLVADLVRVHLGLAEAGDALPLQLGHPGQPQQGEAPGQRPEVQVWSPEQTSGQFGSV